MEIKLVTLHHTYTELINIKGKKKKKKVNLGKNLKDKSKNIEFLNLETNWKLKIKKDLVVQVKYFKTLWKYKTK